MWKIFCFHFHKVGWLETKTVLKYQLEIGKWKAFAHDFLTVAAELNRLNRINGHGQWCGNHVRFLTDFTTGFLTMVLQSSLVLYPIKMSQKFVNLSLRLLVFALILVVESRRSTFNITRYTEGDLFQNINSSRSCNESGARCVLDGENSPFCGFNCCYCNCEREKPTYLQSNGTCRSDEQLMSILKAQSVIQGKSPVYVENLFQVSTSCILSTRHERVMLSVLSGSRAVRLFRSVPWILLHSPAIIFKDLCFYFVWSVICFFEVPVFAFNHSLYFALYIWSTHGDKHDRLRR